MKTTSESLLIRLRSCGRPTGLGKICRSLHAPLVLLGAKNRLGHDDAGDLVQEVLAVLIRKLPEFQYDKQKSFRGWLRRVTLNKRAEQIRRKSLSPINGANTQLLNVPKDDEQFWDEEYSSQLVQRFIDLMETDFDTKPGQPFKATSVECRRPMPQINTESVFGLSIRQNRESFLGFANKSVISWSSRRSVVPKTKRQKNFQLPEISIQIKKNRA